MNHLSELEAEIAVNKSLMNYIKELTTMQNYLTLDNGQIIAVAQYEVVTKESIQNQIDEKQATVDVAQAEIAGLQELLKTVTDVAPPQIETDAPQQEEQAEISQAAPEAPVEQPAAAAIEAAPAPQPVQAPAPETPAAPVANNDVTAPAPAAPAGPGAQIIDLN